MKKIMIPLILLSLLLISCVDEKQYDIYTSVYALTYISEQIVEDKASVKSIYPNNAEVHDYEPSPKSIVKMLNSDAIFYIGQGLEPFIENSINSTFKDANTHKITASSKITLVTNDLSRHGTYYDPHIWLDPTNLIYMTEIILDALLQIDKYEEYYELFTDNAFKLIEKFEEVKLEYVSVFEKANLDTIIVDHNAYNYLAYRYNFKIKCLRGDNENTDPNSKEFIEIINFAVENNLRYLLATKNESGKSLITSYQKQLNSKKPELEATVLYLDNLEKFSTEDFISLLKENLKIFEIALT